MGEIMESKFKPPIDYSKEVSNLKINRESVEKLIKRVQELNLRSYYLAAEKEADIKVVAEEDIKNLMQNSSEIKYSKEYDALVYITESGEEKPLYKPKSKTFSFIDKWVSAKLSDINLIFAGGTAGELSREMESFYICCCIAAVFEEPFRKEFEDRLVRRGLCKH